MTRCDAQGTECLWYTPAELKEELKYHRYDYTIKFIQQSADDILTYTDLRRLTRYDILCLRRLKRAKNTKTILGRNPQLQGWDTIPFQCLLELFKVCRKLTDEDKVNIAYNFKQTRTINGRITEILSRDDS